MGDHEVWVESTSSGTPPSTSSESEDSSSMPETTSSSGEPLEVQVETGPAGDGRSGGKREKAFDMDEADQEPLFVYEHADEHGYVERRSAGLIFDEDGQTWIEPTTSSSSSFASSSESDEGMPEIIMFEDPMYYRIYFRSIKQNLIGYLIVNLS